MDQLTTILPVALLIGGGALVYNQCIANTGKKDISTKATGGKSHTRATDEDEIDLNSFMTARERKEIKNKQLHAQKQAIILEKQRKENAEIEKREREIEKAKKAEKAALEALSPKERKAQAAKNKNNTKGDAKSAEAKKKEKDAQKKQQKDEQKAREVAMAKKLGLAASENKKPASPVQKIISEDEDDGFKTAASKKQRQRTAQKLQKQQDREDNEDDSVSYTPMSANNDDAEDVEEEKVVVEKVTVLVPVQFERRLIIIGKGAETIDQIKQKTDCYISVPQEDTRDGAQLYNNAPIYIKVNGPKDGAAVARKIILELAELGHSPTLNNISGLMEAKFKCEVKQRAMVLGPAGSWLKALQNALDVKIIMPHRLSMDTEIVITGPKNGVSRCKKALSQLLRDGYSQITHPGWLKSSVSVHSSLHRRLIGRAGSVIKRIQNDSGAKIMLPSDNGDYVYVLGSPECIARATVIINELVEEFETAEEERQYKKDRLDDDYEDEIDEESMQYLYQGNY